jgi:hypothetical protein
MFSAICTSPDCMAAMRAEASGMMRHSMFSGPVCSPQ